MQNVSRVLQHGRSELGKVVVGQEELINQCLRTILCGGHALLEGVPGIAPAAKQMGRHAALNIRRSLEKKPRLPFRYRDYGQLATIGRNAAVAMLGKLRFSGYPAWLLWLLAHIYFLINFRNRMVVMTEWAWSYWTYQRYARIIIKPPE